VKAAAAAASVLDIKEFIPGRPWGSQHPSTDAVASSGPDAASPAGSSQGLGMRCSSLADMEKLVTTSNSRLSTSEWSLDVSAGGGSAGSGGPKGIVDPAGSLPALWTPLESTAGAQVTPSKGMNTCHLIAVNLYDAFSRARMSVITTLPMSIFIVWFHGKDIARVNSVRTNSLPISHQPSDQANRRGL